MMDIDITNIGGIRSGSASIEDGVNVIMASNWQGKSSFIAAIEAAMGTAKPLRNGADKGQVSISFDDDRPPIEVSFERSNDDIHVFGEPVLSTDRDRAAASLFAFWTEQNALREAIREGTQLGDILLKPYYIEDIESEIDRLQRERERVGADLDQAKQAVRKASELEQEISNLESTVADLREEFDPSAVEEIETDLEEEHADATSQLEQTEQNIRSLEREIDDLESKLDRKETQLAELTIPEADIDDIDQNIDAVHAELRDLEQRLDLVEDMYQSCKRILDEGALDILTDVERDISGDFMLCWLCGQGTPRKAIESRVESLGEQVADLRGRKNELQARRDDLRKQGTAIESATTERADLNDAIASLNRKINERQSNLEALHEQRSGLEETVADLEDQLYDEQSEPVELQSRISTVETKLDAKREQLTRIESDQPGPVDELEARKEELSQDIADIRELKTRRKQQTREAFNEAMEEIVETFDPSFEGAHLVVSDDDEFEIVIGRDGEEIGTSELSQGEVELVAAITMLAGFEAFDVDTISPVILLDDMGALASQHLEILVNYLEDRTEAVVTTAYPEQGKMGGHAISPEAWDVVSDDASVD